MKIIVSEERLKFLRYSVDSKIIHLTPSMGGEIEQLLKDTEDKVLSCSHCFGFHTGNVWFANPHPKESDGALTDKDGNGWWPYILCSDSNYQHAYRHIKELFVDCETLEKLRVEITSKRSN